MSFAKICGCGRVSRSFYWFYMSLNLENGSPRENHRSSRRDELGEHTERWIAKFFDFKEYQSYENFD